MPYQLCHCGTYERHTWHVEVFREMCDLMSGQKDYVSQEMDARGQDQKMTEAEN